ncbi:Serine/threonine-protein kinase smg1, partial [Nowakowskiella sp. JEL0078]
SIKRFWPFWQSNISLGLEVLPHLLSDIENVLDVSCEPQPGITLVEPTKAEIPRRVSAASLMYFRIFQALLKAICFSTCPTLNSEINEILFDKNTDQINDLMHIVEWVLKLTWFVGTKTHDKLWISYGVDILKFVSKGFGYRFTHLQLPAISLLFLELDLITAEEIFPDLLLDGEENEEDDITIREHEVDIEKNFEPRWRRGKLRTRKPKGKSESTDEIKEITDEVKEWLKKVNEIIGCWGHTISNSILMKFIEPMQSRLLRDIRLKCCVSFEFLFILEKTISIAIQAKENDKNVELIKQKKPELLMEMEELFVSLLLNSDDSVSESSATVFIDTEIYENVTEWTPTVKKVATLEPKLQRDLLLFDIKVVVRATLGEVSGFDKIEVTMCLLQMLCAESDIVFRRRGQILPRLKKGSWWMNIEEVILKSLMQLSISERFFINYQESEYHLLPVLSMVLTRSISDSNNLNIRVIGFAWLKSAVDILCDCKKENFIDDENGIGYLIRNIERALILSLQSVPFQKDRDLRIIIENVQILNIVLERIHDVDREVGSSFLQLLSQFDPLHTLRVINDWNFSKEIVPGRNKLNNDRLSEIFKLSVMTIPHLGTFRPKHFQACMELIGILPSTPLGQSELPMDFIVNSALTSLRSPLPLDRIFHSCQAVTLLKETPYFRENKRFADAADISGDLLTYWSLWESARYCILTRMRTQFGGPTQTFEAIENSLNTWIKVIEVVTVNNPTAISRQIIISLINRVGVLLNFIEILELQIHHAADGGGVAIHVPAAPRASIAFFHTNRRVCEEWFARMRPNIIFSASKWIGTVSANGIVIRNGLQILSENARKMSEDSSLWNSEFEKIVVPLVIALMSQNDPDPIVGIYKWSQNQNFSNKNGFKIDNSLIKWINAAALFAESRFQTAVDLLKQEFQIKLIEIDSIEDYEILKLLISQITQCYLNLNDFEEMSEWLKVLENLEEKLQKEKEEILFTYHSKSYLSSWLEFGREDFSSAVLNVKDEDFVEGVQKFVSGIYTKFDGFLGSSLHNSEFFSLQAMSVLGRYIDYENSEIISEADTDYTEGLEMDVTKTLETAERLLNLAHEHVNDALQLMTSDLSPILISPFIIQSQIVQCLKDLLPEFKELSTGQKQVIGIMPENTATSAGFRAIQQWNRVYAVTRFHEFIHQCKQSNNISYGHPQFQAIQLRASVVTMSRQQGNFKLAMKMLIENSDAGKLNSCPLRLDHRLETAKVQFATNHVQDAVVELLGVVSSVRETTVELSQEQRAVYGQTCAKLAEWAWTDKWNPSEGSLRQYWDKFFQNCEGVVTSNINGVGRHWKTWERGEFTEIFSEQCLKFATSDDVVSAKGWLSYANFYYRQGRKIVDEASSPFLTDWKSTQVGVGKKEFYEVVQA